MRYLLLLDYDGTLTPIVKKPALAALSKNQRALLKKAAKSPRFKIAVISGRMLSDLKSRVGIRGIYYAGNHGFEIEGPGIKITHPKARQTRPVIQEIKSELQKELKNIKGILVEDKILTLSLHYRMSRAEDIKKVKRVFHNIVFPYLKTKKIRVTHGKKVFEVRPNINWHKGKASLWLLKKMGKGYPIYIGDDRTDEDAFKALSPRGLTIRVGKAEKTRARKCLKNVEAVYKLLESMLKLPASPIRTVYTYERKNS